MRGKIIVGSLYTCQMLKLEEKQKFPNSKYSLKRLGKLDVREKRISTK